jgi:16S rRNA (cytosine1402-N4)-methyltransferase
MTVHVPVLLEETLRLLGPEAGDVVIDATFGAGGHSRAIAERIGAKGTLIAIDRDSTRLRLRWPARQGS